MQLKATRLSWPQSPQRSRRKPWARTAALEEGVELVFDELREVRAGRGFGLGEAASGVLLHRNDILVVFG